MPVGGPPDRGVVARLAPHQQFGRRRGQRHTAQHLGELIGAELAAAARAVAEAREPSSTLHQNTPKFVSQTTGSPPDGESTVM